MKINFWSGGGLPMYGTSVEELHLEIRTDEDTRSGYGDHWVVAAAQDGTPRLLKPVEGELVDPIIERLKADIAYHAGEAERLTRDSLSIDTAPDAAYSIEDDVAESYHSGRVEALTNAIDLLLGREVTLYSETQA